MIVNTTSFSRITKWECEVRRIVSTFMPLNAGFTLFLMTKDIDHTILASGEIISTVVVVVVFVVFVVVVCVVFVVVVVVVVRVVIVVVVVTAAVV